MRSRLTALAGEKRERSAGELVNQHNHSHAAAPTVPRTSPGCRDRTSAHGVQTVPPAESETWSFQTLPPDRLTLRLRLHLAALECTGMAAHARNGPIFWSYFKRSDVLVHMCTSGLQLLGFAMSDRHFLYEIHTAFHRYGIGRALMQRVKSSAHEWMELHVHAANVKAQRFYLAMGFCHVATLPGGSIQEWHWRCPLTDARVGLALPAPSPCRIHAEDRILIIKQNWLEMILAGDKTMELRGQRYISLVDTYIWLCPSETGHVIGRALVTSVVGPMDAAALRSCHALHHWHGRAPYARTYGWNLARVQRLDVPIPIVRKPGSVIIQVGPGL